MATYTIDERFLSWARYLYWSELMRQRWDAYMAEHQDGEDDIAEWLGFTSYWYASLYVVVEGWEANRFNDDVIDKLLSHSAGYKALLRRYRNTVFHYQPSLRESRMRDFMTRGQEHLLWTFTLHDEYCRYYRELLEKFPGTDTQKAEFVNNVRAITGFVPLRAAEQKVNELLRTAAMAENIVAKAPEGNAAGLRNALTGANSAIQRSREMASRQRLERLFQLGVLTSPNQG